MKFVVELVATTNRYYHIEARSKEEAIEKADSIGIEFDDMRGYSDVKLSARKAAACSDDMRDELYR